MLKQIDTIKIHTKQTDRQTETVTNRWMGTKLLWPKDHIDGQANKATERKKRDIQIENNKS